MRRIEGVSSERSPPVNAAIVERLGNSPVFFYGLNESEGIVASQLIGLSISQILKESDKLAIEKIRKLTAVASSLYGEDFAKTLGDVRTNIRKDFKQAEQSVFEKTAVSLQKIWSESVFNNEFDEVVIPDVIGVTPSAKLHGPSEATLRASEVAEESGIQLQAMFEVQSQVNRIRSSGSISSEQILSLAPNHTAVLRIYAPNLLNQDSTSITLNQDSAKGLGSCTMAVYENFTKDCENFLSALRKDRDEGYLSRELVERSLGFLKLYARVTHEQLRSGSLLSRYKTSKPSKGFEP